MATELNLSQSPVPRIKRQIRELKSNDDSHNHLLHEVVESNMRTQQAIGDISRSINDFIGMIKSVSEVPESPSAQKPAPVAKVSEIEQKLDKIASQNLQLIELISELVRLLKKEKSTAPQDQTYVGAYPMRPLR